MTHVLDNPIWNALISGNKLISLGSDMVKYFAPDVAPFIGMADYGPENMQHLLRDAPTDRKIVIFSASEVTFPAGLTVHEYISTYQMVYENDKAPLLSNSAANFTIRNLSEKDVPEMLELTAQTKPGPFFQKTIDFGHYEGIFEQGRLVSMAGYRLNPFNYTEISAVCTAPDALGKGYAGIILASRVASILKQGNIPFLHVKTDNDRAVSRYERSGFSTRKWIHIYLFTKD